jgi:hypothetical protein
MSTRAKSNRLVEKDKLNKMVLRRILMKMEPSTRQSARQEITPKTTRISSDL